MTDTHDYVKLNKPFEITNGTKTGIFYIFDVDGQIDYQVNAIPSFSNLGRFLIGFQIPSQIFLLQTLKNINEGFWISRELDPDFLRISQGDCNIDYGPGRDFLPGRISGHLDRGIINFNSKKDRYLLSEMCPDYGSDSDFYWFATNWSTDESRRRKDIRRLNDNLALDIKELRYKTKFFPWNKALNEEFKIRKNQCLDLAEQLKKSLLQKRFAELNVLVEQASEFVNQYFSEYGEDQFSQILLERIDLIKLLFLEPNLEGQGPNN